MRGPLTGGPVTRGTPKIPYDVSVSGWFAGLGAASTASAGSIVPPLGPAHGNSNKKKKNRDNE